MPPVSPSLCLFVIALLVASVGAQLFTYGDARASSVQAASEGSSWLVTVTAPNVGVETFDLVYERVVRPVAERAPALCGMTASASTRRAFVTLTCPADPSVVDRVVALLESKFGATAVRVDLNEVVKARAPEVRVAAAESASGVTWGLDRIDSRPLAFDGIFTFDDRGGGADIWIVDTGVNVAHTEFGGRATLVGNYIGGVDTDCNGHGTHVSAIAAGKTLGVARAARIFAMKVLDCKGSGTTGSVMSALDAIIDARSPTRATIINLSLTSSLNAQLNNMINSLVVDHGIAVVVAAGNDGAYACDYSPGSASAAITVAAVERTDELASFSNYGACVDIAAPGSKILSAWYTSTTAVATLSGTSMASPFVAGVLAMHWSRVANKRDAAAATMSLLGAATPGVVADPRHSTHPALLYVRLIADAENNHVDPPPPPPPPSPLPPPPPPPSPPPPSPPPPPPPPPPQQPLYADPPNLYGNTTPAFAPGVLVWTLAMFSCACVMWVY